MIVGLKFFSDFVLVVSLCVALSILSFTGSSYYLWCSFSSKDGIEYLGMYYIYPYINPFLVASVIFLLFFSYPETKFFEIISPWFDF